MESSQLRLRARENLRGNWLISVAAGLIAIFFCATISDQAFLPQLGWNSDFQQGKYNFLERIFQISLGENLRITFRNGIFGFAGFLLGGTIQLGYAKFLLKQHDGQDPRVQDLFSQFDNFGTGFVQAFLRSLYTVLWSCLFVIPGIVKSLSYAMTPYILAENPNFTATQAIDRSKAMMDGHKMDLFILWLTFIGWDMLSALTLRVGDLFLVPYKSAAGAAFYRQLQAQNRYTTVEF